MSEWDGRCTGCAYIGDVRHMATGPGFSRWCHDCQVAAGLEVGPRPFDGAWGDLDPHGVLPLPQTGIRDDAGILGPGSPYVVPASEDVEATARQRFAESVLSRRDEPADPEETP